MVQNSNIDALLDLYWKGESTLENEAMLRSYFQGDNINEAHLPFKPFFNFLSEEKSVSMESEFSIPKENEVQQEAVIRKMYPVRRWIGVAASLLVLISAFWFISDRSSQTADTYDNPELALQQAKEALFFLSNKMDKGTQSTTMQLKQLEKLSIFN